MNNTLIEVLNTPTKPTGTLEEIVKKVQVQIADIEYVNRFQSCFEKVRLSVDEMKVLLDALKV